MSTKIFGLCENPVSTIDKALRFPYGEFVVPTPVETVMPNGNKEFGLKNMPQTDEFVSPKQVVKSNPIIKMRNGIGKLMKHFSRPIR